MKDGTKNGLLTLGVVTAFAAAACVAKNADLPTPLPRPALGSKEVYRAEIAVILGLAGYFFVSAVWLAAKGELFRQFGIPGLTASTPEDLDKKITDAADHVKESLDVLDDRDEALFDLLVGLEEKIVFVTQLQTKGEV